jgi:hypothetical protein
MDEEGIQIDIAEAIGEATAAISLQSALVAMLVMKEVLTPDDAATLTGTARAGLSIMPISDGAKILAEAALSGFAKTYTKFLTKN